MLSELTTIINSITPISNSSLSEIISLVKFRKIEKGEVFIEKEKRNHHEYFLMNGICRSFLLNPEGNEVTISFFQPNSVLSPYITRTTNGFSNLNFQALTEVVVGEMDAKEFENLMVNNLQIREFGNMVLRMELNEKVEKEINLASLSAIQRLEVFRQKYQGFENIVPHHTISSFLGITHVSLSRLRQKKTP